MDTPHHDAAGLPHRIPAAPDVPEIPGVGLDDDGAETERGPAALARIAEGLRVEESEQPTHTDGFDFDAVLEAVREVSGVREAKITPDASGVHTLRLDLYDNADAARVSREVARLLKIKMGLAAEPRRTSPETRPGPFAPELAGPGQRPAPRPATPPGAGQAGAGARQMPVAGSAPLPHAPLPASATEQLGGPVASRHAGAGSGAGVLSSGAVSSARLVPGEDERLLTGRNGVHEAGQRHPVALPRTRSSTDGRAHAAIDETLPPPLRRTPCEGEPPRVVLDEVQVRTLGIDATVEVRLNATGHGPVVGVAHGPAVDGYVLRLAAAATATAVDELLASVPGAEPGRCYVEHAAVVPLGSCEVAVVVVLLMFGGWVQQLSGSAVINGDPRQAVVRATLAAVNRRIDALLG